MNYAENMTVETFLSECCKLLENDSIDGGVGRLIRCPLLSVFLGTLSEQYREEAEDTYRACWSSNADNLEYLSGKDYSVQAAQETSIDLAANKRSVFEDSNTVMLAYYWDIMDDDFDEILEKLRESPKLPASMRAERFFFVFCSQRSDEEKCSERLKKLTEIAGEDERMRQPVIVLSDIAVNSPLSKEEIRENYRIAATIMTIIDTQDNSRLGINLAFELQQAFKQQRASVCTASYYAAKKPLRSIALVSLREMLDFYMRDSGMDMGKVSVERKICGEGRSYLDLLDQFCSDHLRPVLPKDIAFLDDLPCTKELVQLRNRLSGFSKDRSGADIQDVSASLGGIWDAVYERYYLEPARRWISSQEGMDQLRIFLVGRISSSVSYKELGSLFSELTTFPDTKERVLRDLEQKKPEISSGNFGTTARYLDAFFVWRLKKSIYGDLLLNLGNAIETVVRGSSGFENVLENVRDSLNTIRMDGSDLSAYRKHMQSILGVEGEQLRGRIFPCATESELLSQLLDAFNYLISCPMAGNVYKYGIKEHVDFVSGTGRFDGVVMADCFGYPLDHAGRLNSFANPSMTDGWLYCVMNNSISELIQDSVGNRFLVMRGDRIERLFIYPIAQGDLML